MWFEEPVNLYKLLQVNPQAEQSLIRHAYRYLANIYHPSNELTGDPDMFRKITDAWQLLSDDERRAAYDATLDENETYGPYEASGILKENYINWPEQELRLATLQVLYAARKNDTGGLSSVMIGECLQANVVHVEPTLLWLLDKAFIETGESKFLVTDAGIQYLLEQLRSN
jgi:hypothetical protein